jgi:hypothetical protein
MEVKICSTCGANLLGTGYVMFPCPECESEIYRCFKCRKLGNSYVCEKCGFEGP